jgi:hypothetical protein
LSDASAVVKARFRSWRASARRWAQFGSNARRRSDAPPVFILGVQRSGTSLAAAILNSHSRIVVPGETHFLTGILSQLRKDACLSGIERIGVSREEVAAGARSLMLHYYERYLHRVGKARWGEKTPNYTELAPQIHEVLGSEVRFVYMLRHGMDVVHSFQSMPWFSERPDIQKLQPVDRLRYAARVWRRVNVDAHAFVSRHPELCHVIRFEDLTSRPEATVRALLAFLGEPWEPGVLDYRTFPQTGNRDPKLLTHSTIGPNSRNYSRWPVDHQQAVYALLAPELERCGYATPTLDGRTAPATVE